MTVTVPIPGLHRVCTLDTGVKGRKSENMAHYLTMHLVVFVVNYKKFPSLSVRWHQCVLW